MAHSNDRHRSDSGGGGFMLGLVAGAVLGAGVGLLLAPRAGSETRGAIGERARDLGNMASDQYKKASDSASGWAERGREFVDKARDAVSRGADDAREYVAAATGTTGSGGDFGRS